MSTVGLLQRLGLYIDPDFLSQDECDALVSAMNPAKKTNAGLYSAKTGAEYFDMNARKTQFCIISGALRRRYCEKIYSLKALLSEHFQVSLADKFERPKYLRYAQGDFFSPHTDDQLQRQLNVTVCLNSPEGNADSTVVGYTGGELRLYGLIDKPGFVNRAIVAPAAAGTLIAYPVNVVHEVSPILSGTRYAIVSRFLSAS